MKEKKAFVSKIDRERFSFEAVSRGTHTPQVAKSRTLSFNSRTIARREFNSTNRNSYN